MVAFCHVRGGAERGQAWYRAGRLQHKGNSFADLVACAHTLLRLGFGRPGHVAAMGTSAGGLVVASVAVRFPGLLRAAVLNVPFVDILSSMLDREAALTRLETGEWGDPATDEAAFLRIRSYCPYASLHVATAPAPDTRMLVTAAMDDQRVAAWQPAKFVARLRQLQPPEAQPILLTDFASGHFGSKKSLAAQLAFLVHALMH